MHLQPFPTTRSIFRRDVGGPTAAKCSSACIGPARACLSRRSSGLSLAQPPHYRRAVTAQVAATLALPNPGEEDREDQYDDEIWGVALPALASMLLEPVIGVINTGMIGRLGTQQLGAVSMASIVVSFAGFLFSFLLFLTTPEIASAMVKNDRAEVSRISSKSLWVAAGFAVITTALLVVFGDAIIAIMAPPEPAVTRFASEYVSIRAWGVLPVLVGFVATGTYRGFKDTRTPLYAALGSASCSLVLTYLFLHVFGWGVKGGALAVVVSQTVSSSVLLGLLLQKGMLRWKDVVRPPSFESVLPMLRKGLVLGVRNIISFGMVLYASTLCVRAGSTYQASFEVIRQVWMLTIQFFECLNVATQTLCAAYLGAGNRGAAMTILKRLLQLGMTIGAAVGVVVFALQTPIVAFFSKDPVVIAQVMLALPMVCFMFPFDAAASIMDGSLLAARQTDYMSVVQIFGSGIQFVALLYLANNNLVTSLTIWGTLKVLTGFRMFGGITRNWMSPQSAYIQLPRAVPAAASTTATASLTLPPSPSPTSSASSASATGAPGTAGAAGAAGAAAASSSGRSAATAGPASGGLQQSAGPVQPAVTQEAARQPLTVAASTSTVLDNVSSIHDLGTNGTNGSRSSTNGSSRSSGDSSTSTSSHGNGASSPASSLASRPASSSNGATSSRDEVMNPRDVLDLEEPAVTQDCLAADWLAVTVTVIGAAHDSELVEKRLRCHKPHPESAGCGGGHTDHSTHNLHQPEAAAGGHADHSASNQSMTAGLGEGLQERIVLLPGQMGEDGQQQNQQQQPGPEAKAAVVPESKVAV